MQTIRSDSNIEEEATKLIMPVDANKTGTTDNTKIISDKIESNGAVKVTFRRWIVLFTFSAISLLNAFNWIQYSIIQDVVITFYNESLPVGHDEKDEVVNWLSMVYMICYIPLVFPSMFLLDLKGLRVCVGIGALLTTIGAWIKCTAVHPDRLVLAFVGQTFCAIAQAFTLGVPARLSSLWFGPTEVGLATSIGVFGNQLGTAFGFLIPPSVVPSNSTVEFTATRFYYLLVPMACICTICLIASVIVIRDKPTFPPNSAQVNSNNSVVSYKDFLISLKNLFQNRNFILMLISYGINTGSYYSISTLLNPIILKYFEGEHQNIGLIGLVLVLSGLLGSIIGGVILDRTKLFKFTTLLMYFMSLLSMVLFTFMLKFNIWAVFAAAFLLGFFMTGYLPVGFEFAAELTYPEPEGTSSGLLNTSAQIFGIIFIYGQEIILDKIGPLYSNAFICASLAIGFIITVFIKSDLRRQNAFRQQNNNTVSNFVEKK